MFVIKWLSGHFLKVRQHGSQSYVLLVLEREIRNLLDSFLYLPVSKTNLDMDDISIVICDF